MKLRKPWIIRAVALLLSWFVRIWMASTRARIYCCGPNVAPRETGTKRYIYSMWHEFIMLTIPFRSRAHVLTSQHSDGELMAQVLQFMGVGAVRGSSTKGGTEALFQMSACSQRTHLIVGPDGPRGPRRQLAIGLIFLASMTGLPLVICGFGARRPWRLNSWDRFCIPKPWSTITFVLSEPIFIPPRLKRKDLERYRALAQAEMDRLNDAAQLWADGLGHPRHSLASHGTASSAGPVHQVA